MCGICLHVWINQQPYPCACDIKFNLFISLFLMQYIEFPQIHILAVKLSNIKIFLYMSYRCNVTWKNKIHVHI